MKIIKTKRTVLGVHVEQRTRHTARLQKTLTAYGCSIRTRLGLHEAGSAACSPYGLILLEVVDQAAELSKALSAIPGVTVKKMVFEE